MTITPEQLAQVERMIAPTVAAMGYELVLVRATGGNRRPTLQVMAERADRAEMGVEDCAEISHAVSALLDVEDPIPAAYHLEVSSPGIDRPLVRPGDYRRFAGHEARVETRETQDGRKRFRGRILEAGEETVRLALSDTGGAMVAEIPYAAIARAKLVLTDELLAAASGAARDN